LPWLLVLVLEISVPLPLLPDRLRNDHRITDLGEQFRANSRSAEAESHSFRFLNPPLLAVVAGQGLRSKNRSDVWERSCYPPEYVDHEQLWNRRRAVGSGAEPGTRRRRTLRLLRAFDRGVLPPGLRVADAAP